MPRFGEDGQTYYFDDPDLPLYVGPPPTYYVKNSLQEGPDIYQVRGVKGWIDKLNGGSGDIALWRLGYNGDGVHYPVYEHLPLESWDDDTRYQSKAEAYRMATTSGTWIGQALFMMRAGEDFTSV